MAHRVRSLESIRRSQIEDKAKVRSRRGIKAELIDRVRCLPLWASMSLQLDEHMLTPMAGTTPRFPQADESSEFGLLLRPLAD
jgi:hypothetical protein